MKAGTGGPIALSLSKGERARVAGHVLALLAAALAACGDTLVDHRADLQQPAACAPGTASCTVAGEPKCVSDTSTQCGATCADCTVTVGTPPAGGAAACLPDPAGLLQSTCGYECTGGLLKCTQGCCPAARLAAGAAHTCAVTTAGALYCWGENGEGQATGVPGADVLYPRKRFESGAGAVAAGTSHTCAVVGGEVRCFGRNVELQAPDTVPAAAGAVSLAAGATGTCAVAGGGAVCWGDGAAPRVVVPAGSGATAVVAGDAHACALFAGGRVACWGENDEGQLGDGTFVGSATPVEAIPSGVAVIAAGGRHTCAATATPQEVAAGIWDALLCWGDAPGASYLLAEPQPSPGIPRRGDGSQSIARAAVVRLAAGRTHTCFQESGGSIQCLGPLNNFNQLGNNVEGVGRAETVPGSPGATAFAAGADHSCAVFPDGGIRCWGFFASGQLGNGTVDFPGVGNLVEVLGR